MEAAARTSEACFRNTLLKQQSSFQNVYEEKEIIINPDYIRFIPQIIDLNSFIITESFSLFLEQFESDFKVIKTFMIHSSLLSQNDNIKFFDEFIENILKLDSKKKQIQIIMINSFLLYIRH